MEKGNPKTFETILNKRIFQKIIRSQAKFAGSASNGLLKCILIEVEDDTMTFVSTDGNRLLESKIKIINERGINCNIKIPAYLLTGLCLNVSNGDFVNVLINADTITIDDPANGHATILKGAYKDGVYPKYKQLIPNGFGKKEHEIAFNRSFMNDMASLVPNERTNILKIKINKTNSLDPILLSTDNPEISQRALLMPVQVRTK